MIDALLEAWRLKHVDRAGWLRVGIERPESVAAHSHGVALLVLLLLPDELDRERALTYALLHDLAEARVGDLTPDDGVPRDEKHRRELAAMRDLCADLPRGDALLDAWVAYEDQRDPEARFVRQLDRLDMAVQARAYRDAGHDTAAFHASAMRAIHHPALQALLDALDQPSEDT